MNKLLMYVMNQNLNVILTYIIFIHQLNLKIIILYLIKHTISIKNFIKYFSFLVPIIIIICEF